MHAFQTLDNVFMFRKEKCKECMKQPIASLGLQESGYSYFISSMCKRCRWFGDRMLCQEQGANCPLCGASFTILIVCFFTCILLGK